jgi:hypothetical protein
VSNRAKEKHQDKKNNSFQKTEQKKRRFSRKLCSFQKKFKSKESNRDPPLRVWGSLQQAQQGNAAA